MKKIAIALVVMLQLFALNQVASADVDLSEYDFFETMNYTVSPRDSAYPRELGAIIDKNLETFVKLKPQSSPSSIRIDVGHTYYKVTGVYLKARRNTNNSKTEVYVDYGNGLATTAKPDNSDGFLSINGVTGIKYAKTVSLGITGDVDVYEFAIKGEIMTSDIVQNIKGVTTEDSVNVTWDFPPMPGLSHVEVNGENIGKPTSYTASNLDSLTNYTYEITAVFENGAREKVTRTFRTKEDKVPPGTVTDLTATENQAGNVELAYTFPSDTDFSHVQILRDGVVIASNIKSNKYTDTAKLTSGQEYEYSVVAYDKSGNASTAASKTIKMKPKVMQPIKNLVLLQQGKNVALSYDLPNDDTFSHVTIYRDGTIIANTVKSNKYTDNTQLVFNREYTYKVVAYDTNANESAAVQAKLKLLEKQIAPVTNLKVKQVNGVNVELTYELPKNDEFDHVKIYRNGAIIANNFKDATYVDTTKLKYNSEYTYKVIVYEKTGIFSTDATSKITIKSRDVTNLKADATANDVSFSWVEPTADQFEKVVIYRKEEKVSLLRRVASLFTGGLETPLFETNGTTFKDLTVSSDTSYVYRFAAVYDGEETDGQSVTVRTKKVTASGGGIVQNDDDSYTVTWNTPTDGEMKILVGGNLYATVPASDQSLTIPKTDLKYDLIGKPDIQLMPVTADGKEGAVTKPGGDSGVGQIVGGEELSTVFNVKTLLMISMGLLGLVGLFVLLGLAFRVAPKLIQTIRTAAK